MSRSRLQSLNSNIDHMTCSLSSKNSPRNTVDFEAACSVYIRFRGVNGYLGSDRIEIITGDHTSIADEDQVVEPEALVQVGDGLADGGVVHFVAGPDVMRDRPAGHHHHGDDHLDVVRLAIAAVTVLGKIGRPGALEIGAGDVIEHQVRLEAEQVAEVMIEGHLDLLLGGHELIEGAVPGLKLLEVDPDSLVLVPIGNEPAAPAIAEEVSLQPAGQAMFAGGAD